MEKLEIDMEEIIRGQIANKILTNMPPEEMKKVLEASLAKTLKEVLSPWKVENIIKSDVEKYMGEYLKQPEVQDRIRAYAQKNVDELMCGVIAVIVSKAQDGIKNNYNNFVGKVSYDDVLAKVRAGREAQEKGEE
jgi:uncharacterized membrane protein YheB (UPF0754 family)